MRRETTVEFPSGMVATVRNWSPGFITRTIKNQRLARQPGPSLEAALINAAWISTDEYGPYAFDGKPPWLKEMLLGDLITAQWQIRMLTWGDKVAYDARCSIPGCKGVTKLYVPLNEFPVVKASPEALEAFAADNRIGFTLPVCGKKLVYGLQTGRTMVDSDKLAARVKRESKGEDDGNRPEVLWAARIKEVEDVKPGKFVHFIDNLDPDDYVALKREFERMDFGLDTEIDFVCDECGHDQVQDYPFGLGFYTPVLTERTKKTETEEETERMDSAND